MWAQFFVEKGLLSDHDSATEQWNSQTRMELSEKLDHEMQVFIEAKDLFLVKKLSFADKPKY